MLRKGKRETAPLIVYLAQLGERMCTELLTYLAPKEPKEQHRDDKRNFIIILDKILLLAFYSARGGT